MIYRNYLLLLIVQINILFKEVVALYELGKETYPGLSLTIPVYSERWTGKKWLDPNLKVGQVSGICVGRDNNVYLFHRADRVWNSNSFKLNKTYNERNLGPIRVPTILVVSSNGTVVNSWGADIFYLPHGITVDHEMNVWVTDVALHQVMKFPALSRVAPLLSLGVPFIPGSDSRHFCQPTSVAVTSTGDFFIADGYCNARILKFNSFGVKILEWGRHTVSAGIRVPTPGEFLIPHALTLAEDLGLICVADRENGRVQCFNAVNSTFAFQLKSDQIGPRIFSVAYCRPKGLFFIVNGQPFQLNIPAHGFILTPKNDLIGAFGHNLKTPHDLALSSDCNDLYVAEIQPFFAWKYHMDGNLSDVRAKNSAVTSSSSLTVDKTPSENGEVEGLAGAIMVTGACLVFAASLLVAALVYSRTRRGGCGHCSSNKWLSNGPVEGFKLGNILGHQGFEKLNTTEESDEEQPLA